MFVHWSETETSYRDMEKVKGFCKRCKSNQLHTFRLYERKTKHYSAFSIGAERYLTFICHGCLLETSMPKKEEARLIRKYTMQLTCAEGFELLRNGKIDKAIKKFNQVLKEDPKNLQAADGLAKCFFAQENLDKEKERERENKERKKPPPSEKKSQTYSKPKWYDRKPSQDNYNEPPKVESKYRKESPRNFDTQATSSSNNMQDVFTRQHNGQEERGRENKTRPNPPSKKEFDPYQVLGLNKTSSCAEVKEKFRELIRKNDASHGTLPQSPKEKEETVNRMQDIIKAKDMIHEEKGCTN